MEKVALPAQMPHILVVDDDDRLRALLGKYLRENGFIVSTSAGADDARKKLEALSYDLMVLDVMMPGETGLELAASLRKMTGKPSFMPILLLTARAEPHERIEGLETGVDDYLSKPFEPRELLLRITAVLRRAKKQSADANTPLRLGKWTYDPSREELFDGKSAVRLTEMESRLLRVLAADPGVPVSREQLAERAPDEIGDRTIDVQVTRLRRKIEKDPKNPRYLVTVRGEGYMLMPDVNK